MARISLDVVGRDQGATGLLSKLSTGADKAKAGMDRLSASTDKQAAAELKLRSASIRAQQAEQSLTQEREKAERVTKSSTATDADKARAALKVQAAEVRHQQALQRVELAERHRIATTRTSNALVTESGKVADRSGGRITRLAQRFGLFRGASKEVDEVGRSMDRAEGSSGRLGHTFGRLSVGASGLRTSFGLAATGVGSFIAVVGGLAVAAVGMGLKTASGMEQAQIGFTTMLGSGAKAKAFLSQLQKFAAATPFEFPELVSASQRLLAMGINAKNVVPYMTAIGDAVAGLGGGPELIDQVTTAIGQMSAKGKIQSDELLQLTEAGIPALKILASAYGVSTSKMQDMVTKGKVLSDDALPKLINGLEKGTKSTTAFGGMMEKQSHSMAGLWSTLKDNVNMALSNMVTPAIPAIKAGLAGLIAWTGANGPKLATWVTADVVPKLNQFIGWFRANKTEIVAWFLSAYASAARFGAGVLMVVSGVVTGFNGLLTGVHFVLSHVMDQVIKFLDGFSGLPVVGKKFKDAADSVRRYKKATDDSLDSAIKQGKGIASASSKAAGAMNRSADSADHLASRIRSVPTKHSTLVTTPGADSSVRGLNAVQRQANAVPRRVQTTVTVVTRGVQTVQREIDGITGHAVSIQVGLVRGVGVRGFARGTSSAPAGLALVGERGPELVQFRGGEKVIPNAPTMKRLGTRATVDQELLQPIQLVVDGKVIREVLLKIKRDQGGIALGLA